MTPEQIEILIGIQALARAGSVQTGHSIHYNEGHSGIGWTHVNVIIHPPAGKLIAWYVGIDPDGDDTPALDGGIHITLSEMRQRLTDYIAANRKQEVA